MHSAKGDFLIAFCNRRQEAKILVLVGYIFCRILAPTIMKEKILHNSSKLILHFNVIVYTLLLLLCSNLYLLILVVLLSFYFPNQAESWGKPQLAMQKMVEGHLRKYFEDVVLLEQKFVMNHSVKIQVFLMLDCFLAWLF